MRKQSIMSRLADTVRNARFADIIHMTRYASEVLSIADGITICDIANIPSGTYTTGDELMDAALLALLSAEEIRFEIDKNANPETELYPWFRSEPVYRARRIYADQSDIIENMRKIACREPDGIHFTYVFFDAVTYSDIAAPLAFWSIKDMIGHKIPVTADKIGLQNFYREMKLDLSWTDPSIHTYQIADTKADPDPVTKKVIGSFQDVIAVANAVPEHSEYITVTRMTKPERP